MPQLAQEFKITEAIISADRLDDEYDIKTYIIELSCFEDLDKPYVTGQIVFMDDIGLIQKIKILGTEKIKLTVATVSLTAGIASLFAWRIAIPGHPEPLHLDIIKDSSSYVFKLGERSVELKLKTLVSGDNGPAAIHIFIDGTEKAVLESYFDYDLWQNEAPARYEKILADDDKHKDIRLILNSTAKEEVYLISSQYGTVTKEE